MYVIIHSVYDDTPKNIYVDIVMQQYFINSVF